MNETKMKSSWLINAKDFFVTMPSAAWGVTCASIVTLIAKKLHFDHKPEYFSWMSEAGLILEPILQSIIASFIFYIFLVHIENFKRKKSIAIHLSKWIESIISYRNMTIRELEKLKKTDITKEDNPTKDIKELFGDIGFREVALSKDQRTGESHTILDFLYQKQQGTNIVTADIISNQSDLDPEILSCIYNIRNCSYFIILNAKYHHKMNYIEKLSSIKDDFYNYSKEVDKLETLLKKDRWLKSFKK